MYNDLFERITENSVINFLGLDLNFSNGVWSGQCPKNHPSKSGKSFQISDKKFHCWSCGIGGNLIHLIELVKFGTISKKHFTENYGHARDLACDLAKIGRFIHSNLSQREVLHLEKIQRSQEIIEEILTRATVLSHKYLLQWSEEKIKEKIDLPLDAVKKFKIGYCYPKLLKDLRKEFDIKEISSTGFILKYKEKWKLTLKNRFLFPYIKNKQTVYFSGRVEIGKENKIKYKKLPVWNVKKFPYVSRHLRSDIFYNEDCLKDTSEIVIAEGLGDGILADIQGLNVLACGGINISENRYKRLLQLIINVPDVYICFDQEESNAGIDSAKKIAYYFLQNQKEIKIILLPFSGQHFDLKDFFQNKTKEDFEKIKNSSETLIELEIKKIDTNIDRRQLIVQIRPILKQLSFLDHITINNYLNYLLKNTFKLKISDTQVFKTEIKRLQKEDQKEKKDVKKKVTSGSDLSILNQGIDFVQNTLYYTLFDQQLEEFTDPDTGSVSVRLVHTPYLVSSKKEYLKATDDNLLKEKLYFNRDLLLDFNLSNKWAIQNTDFCVTDFLSGEKTVDTKILFQRVKKYFDNFIIFPKPIISVHFVLIILASYLLAVFDTVGYIHLFAEKRSGKTRLLEILEGLGFNAIMSSSISDSSIFRIIEASRCLLLTDEAENLDPNYKQQQNNPSERLQLLNSGYKKSGAAIRIEKTDNKLIPTKYSTFCIKVFAGTQEINPLLRDRTITYVMKRASGNKVKHFIPSSLTEEWEQVRNQIYFWAMENASRVSEIYRNELAIIYKDIFEEHNLVSREYELWSPYFAIAKCIDEKTGEDFKVFSSLLEITKDVSAYKQYSENDTWINRLVAYIYEFVQQNKKDEKKNKLFYEKQYDNKERFDDYYNLTDMTNFIKSFENFENLSAHRLTKFLYGKLHLIKPQDSKRMRRSNENTKDIWVKITQKKIKAAIKRHEIILDYYALDKKGKENSDNDKK